MLLFCSVSLCVFGVSLLETISAGRATSGGGALCIDSEIDPLWMRGEFLVKPWAPAPEKPGRRRGITRLSPRDVDGYIEEKEES